MTDQIITNKIVRYSIDLEFSEGKPPEKMLRFATTSLLISLARAVENSDVSGNPFFPMILPLELSMHSEQLRWNFRLVAKLENYLSEDEPRRS